MALNCLTICFSNLISYSLAQIWMLVILWRKQKADGFVQMRFMPYSVITNISRSRPSQCICPKVICYY